MSRRNKKKLVYRAGKEEYPALLDKKHDTDEVWLITNPNLYYPLDQDQSPSRQSTRANPTVCLWEADITKSDNLIAKDHSTFNGVCVVEYKGTDCIEKELESLTWVRSTVPKYRGGMSLMDDSTLVQAVLIYMKDHYPTTPQDFNCHAELKAASHWHWSDDDNRPLEPGPHDDIRVKSAAIKTLEKWENELKKLLSQGKNEVSRVSDLEERICVLRMYYDMDMEETDLDAAPKIDQNSLGPGRFGDEANEKKGKKPRNKSPPEVVQKNGFHPSCYF